MKNWKNKYPLNTFKGETKKELVKFIEEIIKGEKEKILNFPKKIRRKQDFVDKDLGERYEIWAKGYNRCLEEVKNLFNT